MALSQPSLRVALYEGSGARTLSGGERFDSLKLLLAQGCSVRRATQPGTVAVWVGDFDSQPQPKASCASPSQNPTCPSP